MGWLFTPTLAHTDGGVDGFIEIRQNKTNELTNLILQVQSKATAKDWVAETEDSFDFRCSDRDLAYWLQGNTPVILVVSRPDTNEAYWISVKDYFQGLAARKSRKIRFNKKMNRFDENAANALHHLAAPVDSGLYSEPPPKSEILLSNFLPLTRYPRNIYLAFTEYRKPADVIARFRELEIYPGHEWFLKDERILSFHDLSRSHWSEVIDQGTVETFDSNEWAKSDDIERRRDFVRLLNQALRDFLGARRVRRFAPKESSALYYFAPDLKKIERRESWEAAVDADRFVVKAIHAKKEPGRIVCYRHQAMQPRFDRFAGEWHLIIEPTYHFTRDGEIPSGYREEYLSGLKRIEKNQAVSNNVRFWEAFLTRQDLFTDSRESLVFGRALKFITNFGIPEDAWYAKADSEEIERLSPANLDTQLALI